MLKSLIPPVLALVSICESASFGGYQGGSNSFPGSYGGFGGYGRFGFNPIFFANNRNFDQSNFHLNEFDRNTNAAVFNDSVHKDNVDASNVNVNNNKEFFSA